MPKGPNNKSNYNFGHWSHKFSETGKGSLFSFYEEIFTKRVEEGLPCIGIRKRLKQLAEKMWSFNETSL